MKRMLYQPQPWQGKLLKRTQKLTIDGLKYINMETNEIVYISYVIMQIPGYSNLYRVEEMIMSEENYGRVLRAKEKERPIEREKFLSENPVDSINTRRMYMLASPEVIDKMKYENPVRNKRRKY